MYNTIYYAIKGRARILPSDIKVKVQASDCIIDNRGYLRYRGKIWVPGVLVATDAEYKDTEPNVRENDILRTKLIQSVYNSLVYSHLGQDSTASILARDFYQPLQSRHVRQFLRNCDHYRRNKVQREHKHSLLRSLLVPDRFFQEISMDFMTDLLDS